MTPVAKKSRTPAAPRPYRVRNVVCGRGHPVTFDPAARTFACPTCTALAWVGRAGRSAKAGAA